MSGHWEEHGLAWQETSVTHCEVCGCLLPRRAWVFADAEHPVRSCGPSCEELWFSYVKPTAGGAHAP
jgi:hypothetical protein